MNDIQKYDYLNLWSTAMLTFLGIGLTSCLSSVKQEYFNPADSNFAVSHFFIFTAVFWVFAFIIHFLSSFILSIKYEEKLQNVGVNMISAFGSVSLLCLIGSVFDFLSFWYVIYLFWIFMISLSGFIIINIESFMKIIGQALAFITLSLLFMGLCLRLGNI
jgi:hypothetical protein